MSITELMQKIEASSKTRTNAQRKELLRKAHIIDKDGYYDARYFSAETVAKDRAKKQKVS
jgi:hypothetical protein